MPDNNYVYFKTMDGDMCVEMSINASMSSIYISTMYELEELGPHNNIITLQTNNKQIVNLITIYMLMLNDDRKDLHEDINNFIQEYLITLIMSIHNKKYAYIEYFNTIRYDFINVIRFLQIDILLNQVIKYEEFIVDNIYKYYNHLKDIPEYYINIVLNNYTNLKKIDCINIYHTMDVFLELLELEKKEKLLIEDDGRYAIFPIRNHGIWQFYEKQESLIWVPGEVDLTDDAVNWSKLTDNEQTFIKNILAFFAVSDAVVFQNISNNFAREVKPLEAQFFYGVQMAIENIHNKMYSLLVLNFVKDQQEQERMFDAVKNYPAIQKKMKWASKWMDTSLPFSIRLISFAIVEGVFFSGAFAAIDWLKHRNYNLPGLFASNDFISRDEGLHCEFAVHLFTKELSAGLRKCISQELINEIFIEAIEIEQEFIKSALKINLLSMSAVDMCNYIEFVANRLIVQLGFEEVFPDAKKCPFDFMNMRNLIGVGNFFEIRPTEYKRQGIEKKIDLDSIDYNDMNDF